jgi:transcriptional regulator with XRE-family HTH domain
MGRMTTTIELIKGLRDMGMTQTAIAKKTGISQPKLSRWEAGEVPDSADDALRLRTLHEREKAARKPRAKAAA